MEPMCQCGHVLDEHDNGKECTVPGCGCVCFDLNPDTRRSSWPHSYDTRQVAKFAASVKPRWETWHNPVPAPQTDEETGK